MNEQPATNTWIDPDDAAPPGRTWFEGADVYFGHKLARRGRPASAASKQAVSLRLDPDVIDWFRKGGPGWQTRMNGALRKAAGL